MFDIYQRKIQYNLPSPLTLLSNPQQKSSFKSIVRNRVIDFWKNKFEEEAFEKPSLKYFQSKFMSLSCLHPL